MHSIKTICLSLFFIFLFHGVAFGGWNPWSTPTLVSIDGEKYTSDDFTAWWQNWKEGEMELPESISPYVDWLLLVKEAEKMKLYESPVYRQKVITFLKARTLMQLKGEEIDQKITITDQDLWSQYLLTHSPRYQVNLFLFKEKEKAETFAEKFSNSTIPIENFDSQHGREDGYFSQKTSWYRPAAINEGWLPILNGLEKGGMSHPIPWKNDFVILRLQEKLEGSKDDFHFVKAQLQKQQWKKEEDRLTINLLGELRKKYKVTIYKDQLEAIDLEIENTSKTDDVIISTSNGDITESVVKAKMLQIQRFRKKNGFRVTADMDFKMGVVNGIIDQTLTSWEALSREYEKKPPFEDTYKFYCQHRMIKLFEETVFIPQAKVNNEEIEQFYTENTIRFTKPEIVRMAIIEGEEETLRSLWLEVTLGGDFFTLARQNRGHEIPVREIPVNHLNPKVREMVSRLTSNELSEVFSVNGHHSLVHLIDRTPSGNTKIEEVREQIKTTLFKQKLETQRKEYLKKLKAEYVIELQSRAWTKLREDLEHKDE